MCGDFDNQGGIETMACDHDRSLSEEVERRIFRFEQTWGTPEAFPIESLLDDLSPEDRADLLRELLYVEFEFVQRRGDAFSLEPYLSRFAEHTSLVREVAKAVREYTSSRHRKIAGYTLLGELGRGGMGVVYRAKSDLLNTLVAFKMVNRHMLENPELLQRFTRELEMIGRLKHPNIVEAKHAGISDDGSPFLVMELLEGMTLSQWSQQNPPPKTGFTALPLSTPTNHSGHSGNGSGKHSAAESTALERDRIRAACTIVRDVALGLQAIHEAGLVHRDIKPSNIMVLPDGRVKILDLGLAKLREHLSDKSMPLAAQTRQGHMLGTPGYMAPEQMHSAANVDIRADIYSLGCTFFFLLRGRAPTEMPQKELTAKLSPRLRTILDKMLAADPATRYREPQEIVAALDALLGTSRRIRKSLVVTGIAAFFVGAFAVTAMLLGTSAIRPPVPVVPPVNMPTEVSISAVEILTANQIIDAIDLRYQGNFENSHELLRKMESDLLAADRSDLAPLLIDVLIAQGDSLFFSGLAADSLPDKTLKRLVAWYEEALTLSADSVDKAVVDRQGSLHCKLAIAGMIHPTENNVAAEHLLAARQIVGEQVAADAMTCLLCFQLAEAIQRLGEGDEQPLRRFAEQFELSPTAEWMTRAATDWRLFALERLITHHAQTQPDKLPQDLRSLDAVLLTPYPDQFACAYLNRFYDLAIRHCDPRDYSQLVKYLCRLRPMATPGTRVTLPPGATLVLLYFSPASEFSGFAIYYPSTPEGACRFGFPYNRHRIHEAIKQGELLTLDAELVTRIRDDIAANTPIVLSWEDAACWSLRRDAVTNEDWPFDASITIEQMLGKLK